jgi:hypothetical protein
MIIKLKSKNPNYPDLSDDQQHFVLGIAADEYRILNDLGKPCLYDSSLLDVLESTEPGDWIAEFGEDGKRYSYPAPLNDRSFFEDFFDHEPTQVYNQGFASAA